MGLHFAMSVLFRSFEGIMEIIAFSLILAAPLFQKKNGLFFKIIFYNRPEFQVEFHWNCIFSWAFIFFLLLSAGKSSFSSKGFVRLGYQWFEIFLLYLLRKFSCSCSVVCAVLWRSEQNSSAIFSISLSSVFNSPFLFFSLVMFFLF